jgi:hypothetical protein
LFSEKYFWNKNNDSALLKDIGWNLMKSETEEDILQKEKNLVKKIFIFWEENFLEMRKRSRQEQKRNFFLVFPKMREEKNEMKK